MALHRVCGERDGALARPIEAGVRRAAVDAIQRRESRPLKTAGMA